MGKRVIQATKETKANVERISNLIETKKGQIRLDTGVVSLVDNQIGPMESKDKPGYTSPKWKKLHEKKVKKGTKRYTYITLRERKELWLQTLHL